VAPRDSDVASALERPIHVGSGDVDGGRDGMPVVPEHHPGVDMPEQISQQLRRNTGRP